jgi:hypothetical protein
MERPLLKQDATAFAFTVPVAPAASPGQQYPLTALIDTFLVTVPAAAANSVFLGFDQGLIVGTGIELLAGTTVEFRVDHDGRQIYECQNLLTRLVETLCGRPIVPAEQIPFVCWDMSQIYMVAAAPTAITMALFKAVYI